MLSSYHKLSNIIETYPNLLKENPKYSESTTNDFIIILLPPEAAKASRLRSLDHILQWIVEIILILYRFSQNYIKHFFYKDEHHVCSLENL